MGGEREASNGLFRELITGREELLEELCFEFSDAFLKAGCCSLAEWSKYLVFCLSFFSGWPIVTAVLVLCFSFSVIILMYLSYHVLIFNLHFTLLLLLQPSFVSHQPQTVRHVILKAALNVLNQTIHASAV